jgi:hypothetical protein
MAILSLFAFSTDGRLSSTEFLQVPLLRFLFCGYKQQTTVTFKKSHQRVLVLAFNWAQYLFCLWPTALKALFDAEHAGYRKPSVY